MNKFKNIWNMVKAQDYESWANAKGLDFDSQKTVRKQNNSDEIKPLELEVSTTPKITLEKIADVGSLTSAYCALGLSAYAFMQGYSNNEFGYPYDSFVGKASLVGATGFASLQLAGKGSHIFPNGSYDSDKKEEGEDGLINAGALAFLPNVAFIAGTCAGIYFNK